MKSTEWRNGYDVGKAGGQMFEMPATIIDRAAIQEWTSGFLVGARDHHSDEIIDELERKM